VWIQLASFPFNRHQHVLSTTVNAFLMSTSQVQHHVLVNVLLSHTGDAPSLDNRWNALKGEVLVTKCICDVPVLQFPCSSMRCCIRMQSVQPMRCPKHYRTGTLQIPFVTRTSPLSAFHLLSRLGASPVWLCDKWSHNAID
jgi:hypothetical protein